MGCGVIEQQKRTQLKSQIIVIEHGADGESVADPVRGRRQMDTQEFFRGAFLTGVSPGPETGPMLYLFNGSVFIYAKTGARSIARCGNVLWLLDGAVSPNIRVQENFR